VPPGHSAHFVRDLVAEQLDLTAILDTYTEERGYPPYHPVMMTALLLYAYTQGVYSSRRIARACEERVDFMAVTAMQRPDFRTISEFRQRHLAALGALFVQVLRLCQRAGLVTLGHVALDGTKIRANASKHKAMSYGHMQQAVPELEAEVEGWLTAAAEADAREDAELGADRRGDELPTWVAQKQQRLAKIRQAMAELEAEAQRQDPPDADPPAPRRGRPRSTPRGVPPAGAQRNFTDPDSRIMKTPDGFQQCYNAQAAVDTHRQVIVAQELTVAATDRRQLRPLVTQVKANTGHNPNEVSADADYCSDDNLRTLERRCIRGYVATGKQHHGHDNPERVGPVVSKGRWQAMRQRLRRGGHRSRYRLRKQTVEPVFGQVKGARGFRQFLLRGRMKVRHEWSLVCTAHNLLKLAAAVA
jgi:transposase